VWEVAAELAVARGKASQDMALIAHQKLRIASLERQLYALFESSDRSTGKPRTNVWRFDGTKVGL
jgi:hypothetical protein